MNPTRKFSFSWCIGTFFLHIGITIGLAVIIFASGMASFTTGSASDGMKYIMWIWSPFAMATANNSGGIALFAAPAWSGVVGILAGFILPVFIKPKAQDPLIPGANPDLVGTPWEQKAVAKLDTLREAQQKQAEQDAALKRQE